MHLVTFQIDGQQFALPLAAVTRIVQAVEVTTLPCAPPAVVGVINVAGKIVAVYNVRRRFGLAERQIRLDDEFLLAKAISRDVALIIDLATDVIECDSASVVPLEPVVPELESFQGVVKLDNGLALIHDLEKFLSPAEAHVLDDAMRRLQC
jgi:purine-binding chemotaxis protein CheW